MANPEGPKATGSKLAVAVTPAIDLTQVERVATYMDRITEHKEFLMALSRGGEVGMNELVLGAYQGLRAEASSAVQYVRRDHETLLVPARVGDPSSAPLRFGKRGLTAKCRGRLGFYKYDVPEAQQGTVNLQIAIRTKAEEPLWGPCFAVPFKPAVLVPKKRTTTAKNKGTDTENQPPTSSAKPPAGPEATKTALAPQAALTAPAPGAAQAPVVKGNTKHAKKRWARK